MKIMMLVAVLVLLALVGCGDSNSSEDDNPSQLTGSKYLISSGVSTTDAFSVFLAVEDELPTGNLSLSSAREFIDGATIEAFGDGVYIFADEDFRIRRFRVEGSGLVEIGSAINLSDRGFIFSGGLFFVSETSAFVLNNAQRELLEWNPTTMTLTGRTIDLGPLVNRDDFDFEFRSSFFRASDATLFIYITYTNNRQTFLNEFKVVVVDLNTGEATIETKADCPASAGFGGFFDNAGDLYLTADSFGTFTTLIDTSDVKANCVLRIRSNSRTLDDGYTFRPQMALGGKEMWGMYKTSDDTFYTSAIDLTQLDDFETPFELIFAPVHEGYFVNFREQTAVKVSSFPLGGVTFNEPINVDGQLLLGRTSGTVEVFEIETSETSIWAMDVEQNAASVRFTMPGFLNDIVKIDFDSN